MSSVTDFDRLALDPEGAETDWRAAIRAGRAAALAGYVVEAAAAMQSARESVRRHEIDCLIEGVELQPGDDAVAVLLAHGLRVGHRGVPDQGRNGARQVP